MYQIPLLINILEQEDGYVEKKKNCPTQQLYEKVGAYAGSDNWTKYWNDLKDAGLPNYQGSYYCISALFWGMMKAFGLEAAQKLSLQKFMINCQVTYELFKKAGKISSVPQPGDLVVFWNGKRFHHAELVVSVKGDLVKTFGANTTAVTSITVYNGGGCRFNKIYSLKAMKASGHKFLRPSYGEQNPEGWVQINDNWKYRLSDGSFAWNTWKYIENKYYYFDKNGIMVRGWLYKNSQWYYLADSGYMEKNWNLVDGKWVYFSQTGELHKGWLQDGDTWYYLTQEDGTMAIGLLQINRIWYYFKENGVMSANEWQKINANWYYFSSTGAAYTRQWKQETNGIYYYLTENGIMANNTYIKDDLLDIYYYVDENGAWDGQKHDQLPEGAAFIL